MNFKEEILKSIQSMIDKSIGDYKADRTFKTVIKQVTPKGYVILDESGSERCVKCCIPNISLSAGQMVWVKIPMGDVKGMYICNVSNGKSTSSNQNDNLDEYITESELTDILDNILADYIEEETEDIDFSNYFEE